MKKSPLERRANDENTAVICQEATYHCASESLAREIYFMAVDMGVKYAHYGEYNSSTSTMTREASDMQVMAKIAETFGKVGKPKQSTDDYVVTCFEEGASYQVLNERFVANCPKCKGFSMRARKGRRQVLTYPQGHDKFDNWMRHRFAQGMFEIPISDTFNASDSVDPPEKTTSGLTPERDVLDIIKSSTEFLDVVSRMSDSDARQTLDAVFLSRTYARSETRATRRLHAVTKIYAEGADPSKIFMAESQHEVDVLDTAAVLGSEHAAALWTAYCSAD